MTYAETSTRDKILLAALELFSQQGIGNTSVDQVAYQAGVTRITVYRYFANKQDLVRAAFLHVEQAFQDGLLELQQNPQASWSGVMEQIGKRLSTLPRSDAAARTDELKRLYPEVYQSVQQVRTATLNGLFDQFMTVAEQRRLLRPGLSRPIVQAVFWELIVNFFDNPRFQSFGLSDDELYQTLSDILLHGILKSDPPKTRRRAQQ